VTAGTLADVVTELVTRTSALEGAVVRLEGFAERTATPFARREVAYPAIPVIVSFGPGWRIGDQYLRSFVAGLYAGPTSVAHDGEAHCMQLDLTPLAAHALFRFPMHELAGRCVPLEDLLPGAEELVERLATAPGWPERFALLECFLAERLQDARTPPDAGWAWRRLQQTGGQLPVEQLARELGCSRRHLAARFKEHVGLPPKTVARIQRFHRAVGRIQAGHAWTDVAHDCGYYDQPHFNRDFRALAGVSPTEFVASRLPGDLGIAQVPFVQDAAPAAA
jgi:AraC-like DNA-binding protein